MYYVPPASSNYLKLNNIDTFSILEKDIAHFNSLRNVITCSDFNARIRSGQDGIVELTRDNDFITLPNDYQIDNLPRRRSLDTKTNRYKKRFLDLLSSLIQYCIHTKKLSCLKCGVEFDMNDILHEFKNLHHF